LISAEVSTRVRVEMESTIAWIFGSTTAAAGAASVELYLTATERAGRATQETRVDLALSARRDLDAGLSAYMVCAVLCCAVLFGAVLFVLYLLTVRTSRRPVSCLLSLECQIHVAEKWKKPKTENRKLVAPAQGPWTRGARFMLRHESAICHHKRQRDQRQKLIRANLERRCTGGIILQQPLTQHFSSLHITSKHVI
jgi:hypothetical protein